METKAFRKIGWVDEAYRARLDEQTSNMGSVMENQVFDLPSIGKSKFGMMGLIASGLGLFTILYFDPPLTQLLLGGAIGAVLFAVHRYVRGTARFSRRRQPWQPWAIRLIVVAVIAGIIAREFFLPEGTTLILPRNLNWIYFAILVPVFLESVDGYLFFSNMSSTE